MDKKIKVLQFPVANSKGGITQYALQNWKFIDKSRFQFDFATMSKSLSFAKELEREGCKIFYISCYAEENETQFIKEFKKILLDGNYDVIHLHTKQWKSFNIEKIAREVGVKKIIVHAHNTGIDTMDLSLRAKEIELHNQMLDLLSENIATDFWACSQMAADFLFSDKISREKIKIMYNAIDLERFKFNIHVRQEIRNELKIDNSKFVIGHVGRFAYQKNHEFLVDIFSSISKQEENAILLLIGGGDLEDDIHKKVDELGIQDKVIFMGKRDNVQDLLQAMDIFVMPSRFEGLGIAAVEAQAAGLKCICSDVFPKEVRFSDTLEFLPLQKKIWEECIVKYIRNSKSLDGRIGMSSEKYDILNQIKHIESGYLGGVIYSILRFSFLEFEVCA